jgi:hypothetical protein
VAENGEKPFNIRNIDELGCTEISMNKEKSSKMENTSKRATENVLNADLKDIQITVKECLSDS